MDNYYNLDGIKTELKKRIDNTQALLQAWQAVTFPTKKDGSQFASMSKNIKGAKYTDVRYSMQVGEKELTVYTHSNLNGYISDSITCYECICYLKDESMKAKTQNYLPKTRYLNQIYTFDLDDIKKAVEKRINYLKEYLNDLNSQYDNADLMYNSFKEAYNAAMDILNGCNEKYKHNDLYYMVRDVIKDRYPYC